MPRELADALITRRSDAVRHDTWGHLKAGVGHHPGYMIFAEGEYREVVSLRSRFDTAPSSPWFYADQQAFFASLDTESATIYVFNGHYRVDDAGAGEFVGTVVPLDPARLLSLAAEPPSVNSRRR